MSAATADDRVCALAEPAALADFTLTDQTGQPLRFSSLRGHPVLVFFGFTHCPRICPAAMFKLRLTAESLTGNDPRPTVLMISVDGERDTPEVMKKYLSAYSEAFIGLTGDPRTVGAIAANFKAVFFKGLPADKSGNYLVEHTAQTYLVDDQGRLRATFFDAPVEAMVESVRSLAPSSG